MSRGALVVTTFGEVGVLGPDGARLRFGRAKAEELVVWLATHPERSGREAARSELWEHPVADATFANVASDARRTVDATVERAVGASPRARSRNGDLAIGAELTTDVDLVEAAIGAARNQGRARAIAILEPAVGRLRGLPFESTGYAWTDLELLASRAVVVATTAVVELAVHQLELGDVLGVFRSTGRGLQLLPEHDRLCELRSLAFRRAGGR